MSDFSQAFEFTKLVTQWEAAGAVGQSLLSYGYTRMIVLIHR